jgi:Raf kinase inhibitor-like YbhB/YbcL family protein
MKLRSDSFSDGAWIPAEFAFGRPGDAGEPCVLSANRSPHLAWDEAPPGTRSFALLCIDPDAPTRPDDVNQPDREVPASLPRCEFSHWAMADIPAELRALAAGACGDGVTPGGKRTPPGPPGSRQGLNDYAAWFAGDADMGGDYLGYDGPCPPFNDALVHRYVFSLFALDVERLDLPPRFSAAQLREAMAGHVLAEAQIVGRYSLNPRLRDD